MSKKNKNNIERENEFLKIYKVDREKAAEFAEMHNLYERNVESSNVDALAKFLKSRNVLSYVLMVAAGVLILFFVFKCSSLSDSDSNFSSGHPVEKWMSDYDGSIFDFEYDVKKMLHDPSSFEHVETGYIDSGSEVKVRMIFRAKNKLGALVLNEAHGILNTSDGSVSNIRIEGQ